MRGHRIQKGCGRQICKHTEQGLTLVELMISLAIGLFVVLAASALLVSVKTGYVAQDDDLHIQDTGRYAIEIISRTVRQAGFVDWTSVSTHSHLTEDPRFYGLDARTMTSKSAGIASSAANSINGSDVLAVRLASSDDGGVINCAGSRVATESDEDVGKRSRGWSIFYVAEDSTGEAELYCKYRGDTGWSSQAIARGVESFQVLYGLDTDSDGLPNRLLNASAIEAMDDSLSLAGSKSHWRNVVAIKVALLIRGTHAIQNDNATLTYDLFGSDYANTDGGTDPGVRINTTRFPKKTQGRLRHLFSITIQLRGRLAGLAE